MKIAAQQAEKAPSRKAVSAVEEQALKLLRELARETSRRPAKPPLRPDRRNRYVLGSQ